MAIHLPFGSLKTRSGLEPVPRCEPSTYQPLADDITTAPSGPVFRLAANVLLYTPPYRQDITILHCQKALMNIVTPVWSTGWNEK